MLWSKDWYTYGYQGRFMIFSAAEQKVSYQEAQNFCRGISDKTDVITLESTAEEEQLDVMLQFKNRVTYAESFWIGLDSLGSHEGSYRWSSKAPIFYLNWAYGEPSNKNLTERCTVWQQGKWYNTHCAGHQDRLTYFVNFSTLNVIFQGTIF